MWVLFLRGGINAKKETSQKKNEKITLRENFQVNNI